MRSEIAGDLGAFFHIAADDEVGRRAMRNGALGPPQQLRQLGDIRRDPPRLILAEQLGGCAPARLIFEID